MSCSSTASTVNNPVGIIPNLIYFLNTRAGMYLKINNKALIFTRDTSMCAIIEALKSWLLIG